MMDAELRDHFAGIALAGLIAKIPLQELGIDDETVEYNNIASSAYLYANAMMEERNDKTIFLDTGESIEKLELSVRTTNYLMSQGIDRVCELLESSEHELYQMPNFGKKSILDIRNSLKRHGLKLKGDK